MLEITSKKAEICTNGESSKPKGPSPNRSLCTAMFKNRRWQMNNDAEKEMKEIVRLTRYNRVEGLLDGPNCLGDRQPQTAVMRIEQIVLHAKHGTGILYICASSGTCPAGFASPLTGTSSEYSTELFAFTASG
ncbi:hypothetical protein N7527_007978 [Penicillium freii]|nr:hypothetical protein N7527_007978 [Penicillium freii]